LTSIEWATNSDGTPGEAWNLTGAGYKSIWTPELVHRFWGYVKILGPDDCWLWTGGRFTNGYGQFRLGKKKVKSHRCALELSLGRDLLDGLKSLHQCDNPPCCNPGHLFEGSDADNAHDRDAKGRGSHAGAPPLPGERNPAAKLAESAVLQIRASAAKGLLKTELASAFGMSKSQIGNIVAGRCWKDGPWPQQI
jgi:hypothetical protein